MSAVPRQIDVFIASPGDLVCERTAFRDVCLELNKGFGDGAGVRFEPLGWEDTLSSVGRRSQSVINLEIDRCEIFVLVIHRRWGQEAPDSPYSSYTEEEFHRALDRLTRTGTPEIFVFFKNVDPGQVADPGPQLQRVLSFRRELENSRQVLYHTFSDVGQFRTQLDRHLRSFAKGNLPPRNLPLQPLILPFELREQVRTAQKEAERQADRADKSQLHADEALARADVLALTLAERAAAAAAEGRVEQARQDFAKATEGTNSLEVLRLATHFYCNTGELNAAEQLLRRQLALLGDEATLERAHILSNLANVYCDFRDFSQAERIALEALGIYRSLGEVKFVAQQEAEIGVIYLGQGKFAESKAALFRAGDTLLALERVDDFIIVLGNCGILASEMGQFEMAEELLQNALNCEETMQRVDGIARACHNLGLVYLQQQKLESAEQVLKRAIEMSEEGGNSDSIMRAYGALALVAKRRGDQDGERQMVCKGREVAQSIGRADMEQFFDEW